MRLELEDKDLDAIAEAAAAKVVEALRPLLVQTQVDEGRLMDLQECAEYLQVKKQWLYKRVSYGEIPHKKLGRHLRFSKAEVDEWINRAGKMPQLADLSGKLKIAK